MSDLSVTSKKPKWLDPTTGELKKPEHKTVEKPKGLSPGYMEGGLFDHSAKPALGHLFAPTTGAENALLEMERAMTTAPGYHAAKAANHRLYTSNPNEVPTGQTELDIKHEVLPALERLWPEATPEARKVIAAQIGAETGGVAIFNFNVGNKKAGPGERHMYLRGTWEHLTPAQVAKETSGPYAHLVHVGKTLPDGKVYVVFDPPHPQSRFAAKASLDDGLAGHVAYYKKVAAEEPKFAEALAKGDTDTIAHILKARGYFSGDEPTYQKNMRSYYKAL